MHTLTIGGMGEREIAAPSDTLTTSKALVSGEDD